MSTEPETINPNNNNVTITSNEVINLSKLPIETALDDDQFRPVSVNFYI